MIEPFKTRRQETVGLKMNTQMETFAISIPKSLIEEGKWLLAVTSFEATNFVFFITMENNSFSITIPGRWVSKSAEKTIDELNILLEFRSQDGIELHVKEIRRRGKQLETKDNKNKLSGSDTQKNQLLEETKNAKYSEIVDLAYRLQITYDEIIDFLDLKYIPTKRTGYSLNPGIYEISDINTTQKYILRDNVKVSVTIVDIRRKSNLRIIQTLIFTSTIFFCEILGFTRSRSDPLDDIDGFYPLIAGSYKSDRPINITAIDKILLKCDSINGIIVNGIRQPIYTLLLSINHRGENYTKNLESDFSRNINKYVLSHDNLFRR